MATFKAEVYAHQKKKDGTYNIKIRVTHNGEKRYLATPYFIYKEDITQKTCKIKNQHYIDLTDELIRKYRKRCDVWGERLKKVNVDKIVEIITSEDPGERFDLDFIAYARKFVEKLMQENHEGNARTYKVAINNLVKFVGRESISIHEINSKFVSDWIDWIKKQPAPPKKKKGERAQSSYPSCLRAIHNQAKVDFNDEDSGTIRIPLSPFKKLPKVPVSRKRALEINQVKKIAKLEYSKIRQPGNSRFNLAKDIFLLSFALVGMNTVDLYECDLYKDGRITYQRKKTKNRREDKAEISIKVEPEIQKLVEKYRDPKGKRVFCFYHSYSSVDAFSAALNKGLKKIGKLIGVDDLEFYAARHSWATIARNDADVDKYTVHSALNHVDEEMKATDIYIKKSWDPIDRANRKVLDLVKLDLGNLEEPMTENYIKKHFCLSNLPKQK